jgi:hypothetical protein
MGVRSGEKETCVRAMTAVYNAHASTIGAVPCLPYLLSVLDNTHSSSLREVLFPFLLSLVAPESAAWDSPVAAKAAATARANATSLVAAGAVEVLVDTAAMAHLQPRTLSVGPGGPALLMDHAQSESDAVASWYWYAEVPTTGMEASEDGAHSKQ